MLACIIMVVSTPNTPIGYWLVVHSGHYIVGHRYSSETVPWEAFFSKSQALELSHRYNSMGNSLAMPHWYLPHWWYQFYWFDL